MFTCECPSGLSARTVSWCSLNNHFVEIDGKGSITDMQRAEHSVLGMGQGSEELPVALGCQSCSICAVRLGEFSLKIFSYGKKPLWEQVWQLLFPLQMWVHFPLLGNEWELFYRHQIATGALEVELWPVLQRAESKWWKTNRILINTFSLAQEKLSRNYILALCTRSVRRTVNIWVVKEMGMGAVSSVLHPVAYMELSCQHRILAERGGGGF